MKHGLLAFTVNNSMNHGLPHGFWWEQGAQTQTWRQAAAQAVHINMDPVAAWNADLNMSSCSSIDGRCQHGLGRKHEAYTLTCCPAAARSWRSLMRPHLENEPFSILDILLLLRARVIVQLGTKLGAEPTLSSRLLHTSLLALLDNGKQVLIAVSYWFGSRLFDF